MKSNYKDLDAYFLDLIEYVDKTNAITIDFTCKELNIVFSEYNCKVLDYLREELWDDAIAFGDGTTFTFELPMSETDINYYSQLWKPKWNFLKDFLTVLNIQGVTQVNFYLGEPA
jgi:hypothetical protein